MPLFPSPQWMDAFSQQLLHQERIDEVASVLDGVYRFVIEPEGPLGDRHSYDVEIRPADGGAAAARLQQPTSAPRLTMTAGYERWRQLITGQLDVRKAMLLRRLKVRGDLSPLLGGMSSAQPLMDALRAVDTRWR